MHPQWFETNLYKIMIFLREARKMMYIRVKGNNAAFLQNDTNFFDRLIGDVLMCTSRFLLFAVCTAFLGLREKEFGRVLQHSGVDRVAVNQMLNS